MLLIETATGNIYYSDFGRYHTPNKHGRVRNHESDPDTKIPITADIDTNGGIKNIEEILQYLFVNKANHGEGHVIAGIQHIDNFTDCYNKSIQMHERDAIPYGPFTIGGTNCSRYVAQVSLAGNIGVLRKILLQIPYTLTPTPRSNVRIINSYSEYYIYDAQGIKKGKTIHLLSKKLP